MKMKWVIAVLLLVAVLPGVVGAKGSIPTNPAKGSQYQTVIGRTILLVEPPRVNLRLSLTFCGVQNLNTVVLESITTGTRGGSDVGTPVYLYACVLPTGTLEKMYPEMQQVATYTPFEALLFWEGYGTALRITADGTGVFVDVVAVPAQ